MKVQVAHFKLCYSRAFMLRAYPLQTHEMLFDAHNTAWRPRRRAAGKACVDDMRGCRSPPVLRCWRCWGPRASASISWLTFGFLVGRVLGVIAAFAVTRPPEVRVQWMLGVTSLAIVILFWILALR